MCGVPGSDCHNWSLVWQEQSTGIQRTLQKCYENFVRHISKEYGGYMCRYFTDCEEVNEASFVHLMETAVKALDNIRETITK